MVKIDRHGHTISGGTGVIRRRTGCRRESPLIRGEENKISHMVIILIARGAYGHFEKAWIANRRGGILYDRHGSLGSDILNGRNPRVVDQRRLHVFEMIRVVRGRHPAVDLPIGGVGGA